MGGGKQWWCRRCRCTRIATRFPQSGTTIAFPSTRYRHGCYVASNQFVHSSGRCHRQSLHYSPLVQYSFEVRSNSSAVRNNLIDYSTTSTPLQYRYVVLEQCQGSRAASPATATPSPQGLVAGKLGRRFEGRTNETTRRHNQGYSER